MRISNTVICKVVEHALSEKPREACGYLAEADGVVVSSYPLRNTDESSEHFTMDPAEQFEAVRKIRSDDMKLFGVYHSHPDTPARPSDEDIRLAFDPNMCYVIVSLAGNNTDIKAYRIRKGRVDKEDVNVAG